MIDLNRLLSPAMAFLAVVVLAPLSAAPANGGFYSATQVFVPRDGNGEGTVSAYGGTSPTFEKNAQGTEFVQLPATGKNEANFVWTFWGHRRPAADQWPAGPKHLANVTVTSATDVTLRSQLFVRSSDWSAPVSGPSVKLVANQPGSIEFPLPASLPTGPIEAVRVVFSAAPRVPALTINEFSVGEKVAVAVYPSQHDAYNPAAPLTINGRSAPGASVIVQARAADGRVLKDWRITAGADGRFSFQADPTALPAGPLVLRAATRPASGGDTAWSADASVYLYPVLQHNVRLPSVSRDGRNLIVDGKPWAFLGLNYTRFLLEFSLPGRANHQTVAEDLRRYGSWGITALRVPLHLGMFQPRPGVFPDSPDYDGIIKGHKLDADFFKLFNYFVAVAGHHGIRVIIDWHEVPTDPYRYFVGGNLNEQKEGKPGSGIAWLYDQETKKAAEPGCASHT